MAKFPTRESFAKAVTERGSVMTDDLELSDQLELFWAQCNVNNFTILCGVCYHPPNQSADEERLFFESLQLHLDKINSGGYCMSAIVLL